MFGRLANITAKASAASKAAAANKSTSATTTSATAASATTANDKTEQETEQLPSRRDREGQQQEEENDQQEQQNNNNNQNEDDEDEEEEEEEDESPEEIRQREELKEQKLVKQLPAMVQALRQKLQEAEDRVVAKEQKEDDDDDDENQGEKKENKKEQNEGNHEDEDEESEKMTLEDLTDDVVRLWCLLRLTIWRLDVLVRKRRTDPDDFEEYTKSMQKVREYELAFRDVTPLIDGLRDHAMPKELSSALHRAYTASVKNHNMIEAENIYFKFLLGNQNWHLGLSRALHARAAHENILQGNVKSMLHNAEIRKMMLVFKELMSRDYNEKSS